MEDRTIHLYLSRILSGQYIFIHKNVQYCLVYPNIDLKYRAEIYANQEYEDSKYNDWISQEDLKYVLIDFGLWKLQWDIDLEKTEKKIEDTKIELYKNHLNPAKIKTIRKSLSSLVKSQTRLLNAKHAFDHITLEGYCNTIKNDYLLIHSIYDANNNLVFDKDNTDLKLLSELSTVILNNNIEPSDFKEIARSAVWRNYWGANQSDLFGRPTIDWTDEQKTLVVISKMYDQIYEHTECPPDKVIEDDDMLEGWMLLQKREHEKNKNRQNVDKLIPDNLRNAQEIFITANSREEAKAIQDMNDIAAQQIINERRQVIGRENSVAEQNLPDIRRDLVTQLNSQRKNHMRK